MAINLNEYSLLIKDQIKSMLIRSSVIKKGTSLQLVMGSCVLVDLTMCY